MMVTDIRSLKILLFLFIFYVPAVQAQQQEKPNIIIIMADDMGYGDLSCYGHPLIRTKHIDQLAGEGIRLTSFYAAASTCTPSRAALLTGRYPLRTGLPDVIFPESPKGLPATEITIAKALKAEGYQTMCVGKWHLGQTKKEFLPLSHGFDGYFGLITSNDMKRPWVQTEVPLHIYRDMEPTDELPVDQQTLTTRYTEEAVKFIKRSKGKPFFLYMPHNMPHVPLAVDKRHAGKSAAGLYGDVIESIDRSVGEICRVLKENKLDNNTIIIFTSDNGPWNNMPDRMFKEDIVKPWDGGSAGLLRGGKTNSYEGGFRVPFIVRWPGKITAGQVTAQVMTNLDLFPTLLAAAGGKLPSDRQIDGENVLPVLKGETAFERKSDFFYFQGVHLQAIRSGAWKLRITRTSGENKEPLIELFNLLADPGEHFNRAIEQPEIVRALKDKMTAFKLDGSVTAFK